MTDIFDLLALMGLALGLFMLVLIFGAAAWAVLRWILEGE